MPQAPVATATSAVNTTSIPKPVMTPAQQAPVTQPISTTSMPKPQMSSPAAPATKGPDIAGYIKAAQQQGISSDDIYTHLKQLGYVDQSGAISTSKQAVPAQSPSVVDQVKNIPSSIGQTFEQGGKNVMNDLEGEGSEAQAAGGGAGKTNPGAIAADAAADAAGTGHVAGDIAGTAGGILGDVISPFLPDSVKSAVGDASKYVSDKVNAIPGMTPEIAKSLGDLFNAGTLAGGGAAEEAAPEIAGAAGNAIKDSAAGVKNSVSDAASTVTNKVRDVATPEAPKTMQTLIDRVKTDPIQAKNTADLVKSYIETAKKGVTTGGEDTATKTAGHAQFGKAMSVLSKNLKASGSAMNDALKSVGNAKVSGVGDVLDNLKTQTADRIGAEYTPLTDSDVRDSMSGMSPSERYQHLNDMIDGKVATPGDVGAFKPTEESGGQMAVKEGTELKKLADLHESLQNLGDNPSVKAVHNLVQRWQEELDWEDHPTKVGGIMNNIVGQLNEKVKGATAEIDGGKYTDAKADYSRQMKVRNHAEGLLGDDMKHSGTVMKRLALNNVTGNVNKYVKDLEGETGVPIIDHATIANFADRLASNPQAQSLLESGKLGAAHKIEGLWGALKGFDLTKPIGSTADVVKGAGHLISDPQGKIMRQLGQDGKPSILEQKPDMGAGLSTKDITSKLNNHDKALMQKYIDNVRLPAGAEDHAILSNSEEADVLKMNEILGINPDSSAKTVADKYDRILSSKK